MKKKQKSENYTYYFLIGPFFRTFGRALVLFKFKKHP